MEIRLILILALMLVSCSSTLPYKPKNSGWYIKSEIGDTRTWCDDNAMGDGKQMCFPASLSQIKRDDERWRNRARIAKSNPRKAIHPVSRLHRAREFYCNTSYEGLSLNYSLYLIGKCFEKEMEIILWSESSY